MKTIVVVAVCFGMVAGPAYAGRSFVSVKSFASGPNAYASGHVSSSASSNGSSVTYRGSSSGGGGVRVFSSKPPFFDSCSAPCTLQSP